MNNILPKKQFTPLEAFRAGIMFCYHHLNGFGFIYTDNTTTRQQFEGIERRGEYNPPIKETMKLDGDIEEENCIIRIIALPDYPECAGDSVESADRLRREIKGMFRSLDAKKTA